MGKKGFSGGMPGNMNQIMKQAQRMQRQMEEKQKELESKEWEATSGGGAVKVRVSGQKEVVAIEIAKDVVDPDDVEMLQDLIMTAVNEAFRAMEEETNAEFGGIAGGLSGFGGLGDFGF